MESYKKGAILLKGQLLQKLMKQSDADRIGKTSFHQKLIVPS